ncbi:MAG: 50S ribosomal protein L25, partial [Parcubacteria group bacterium]|nr:50S ribosomal protein L25 [Parcubacteria group bacterium]
MNKVELKSKTRKKLGKVKSIRAEKNVPCILYGPEIKESIPLEIDYKEFKKAYKEAGESTIIELSIDDKDKKNVLIKDIQLNPISSDYNHVDFYQINMKEKIFANVELSYVGVSPAVKDLAGILAKNMNEIEVHCLPGDLPKEIVVDISALKTFDDFIKIKDLEISDKVEISANDDDIVVTTTPPRSEKEIEALDEEVEEKVDEVEGVTKEEEGEEAEGEE